MDGGKSSEFEENIESELLVDDNRRSSLHRLKSTQSKSIATQFTTNGHGVVAFLERSVRSLTWDHDPYVQITLLATNQTQTTAAVFGARQNAQWDIGDNHQLRFVVPKALLDDDRGNPIHLLVQVWDKDLYSFDDFIGARAVDLRPLIDANVLSNSNVEINITDRDDADDAKCRGQLTLRFSLNSEGVLWCTALTFEGIAEETTNCHKAFKHIWYLLLFTALVFSFSAVFWLFEGWPFLDCVYFMIVAVSSVGYGDMCPVTRAGKITSMVVAIMSLLGFMTVMIMHVENIVTSAVRSRSSNREQDIHWRELAERLRKEHTVYALENTNDAIAQKRYDKEDTLEKQSAIGWDLLTYLFCAALWCVLWCVFFVHFADTQMTCFDALYFAIISSTTVGFGDHHAGGQEDRMIFIAVSLPMIVAFWTLLAKSISAYIKASLENKAKQKY